MNIDFITCSVQPTLVAAMQRSARSCLPTSWRLRFITVTDAVSIVDGYSRGLAEATADWVVFCHDDVEFLSVDARRLLEVIESSDVIGVCGTAICRSANWYASDRSNLLGRVVIKSQGKLKMECFGASVAAARAQAIDGIFMMVRREVACALGFSPDIKGFTCYDIDFSFRAHLRGYRVVVTDALDLLHLSQVGDFSDAKISAWKENQRILEARFNFHRQFPDYVRHEVKAYK